MSRRLTMPRATPPRMAHVTDHALLRWIERHLQVDIEALRASILTPSVVEAIECGASAVHCREEGVTLIVAESGAIKTVLPIKRVRHHADQEGAV
ncbi:hypothetical protein D3C71_314730 [compost metagenome]